MSLFFVDCEAEMGVGAPSVGDMTCFGAVCFDNNNVFYGEDCSEKTFTEFNDWIKENNIKGRPTFISDNPAYDWQWINFYFWKYQGSNPFGHSARRIGDYWAGLTNNFYDTTSWKKHRITKHDHHPVHDALGNVEAVKYMFEYRKL